MPFCSGRKETRLLPFLAAALILFSACSGAELQTGPFRFAVTGNTSPMSPFSGFTPGLKELFSSMESRNPSLIIHTGNIVYGGSSSSGITPADMERQYSEFSYSLKSVHCPVYTLAGEKDSLDSSTEIYSRMTGRPPYYSVNYGRIHLIMLHTGGPDSEYIDTQQLKWLKKELKETAESGNTIIITHHRMNKGSSKRTEYLHRLFLRHRVRAVVSGEGTGFRRSRRDSIEYIEAGCSDLKNHKRYSNHFYTALYRQGKIDIEPCRLLK